MTLAIEMVDALDLAHLVHRNTLYRAIKRVQLDRHPDAMIFCVTSLMRGYGAPMVTRVQFVSGGSFGPSRPIFPWKQDSAAAWSNKLIVLAEVIKQP